MDEIEIRRVRPDEWASLRAVRLAALTDAPGAFGAIATREQAFDEAEWRRRAANPMTFLAWQAGRPVGLASGYLHDDGPGSGSSPEWELASMWVSPEVRGSGCADLLVSAVVEAVRAESAPYIVLWVAAGNSRARAFYLRAGFAPTGIWQLYQRDDGSSFDDEKLLMSLGGTGSG